jgi:PAS domain S-box-containing protein
MATSSVPLDGTVPIEAALRSKDQWVEKHLRALIDALPTAVYTTDAQGRITHFNPACVELSGRVPELGSDHWCVTWKLFHPDGRPMPHAECPMAVALRERRIVRGEPAIAERPDGSRIWFEPYPTPLFDDVGELIGGVNMLVDVTEKVRAARAASDRQAVQSGQRAALEAALNGDALETSLGVLVRTATAVFGHDTRAAVYIANTAGTALHHVVGMHPDYAAAVDGFVIGPESLSCGLAVATGQPVLTEDVLEEPRWKDWRWLARRFDFRGCWSFPIHTAARRFDGTLAVYWRQPRAATALDVELASLLTETAAAILAHHGEAEARKRAEQVLAAIVQSSSDSIVSVDLDGTVTTWNEGAERLFGHRAQDIIGRSVTLLSPPDRLDEEVDILARIRRGERIEHLETKRLRKDGSLLDVSLTVSPIKDSGGRIIGASKIARDITERVQAQEALREADRHKDEFLAMLAHELRGPLAPLRYVLEIMKRAEDDEALLHQARDSMDRQLSQLVRLVDDLLDVSRISRGRLELKRERVEVGSVMLHAIEACRPLAEIADVELIHALPPEPMYLHADAARLAQVLGNLIHNACKYSERGSKVWVTAEREGHHAALKVKDTGVGIPPEKLVGIFEMFAQVDQSLTRSQGGLGIGLTLVKELVEMHGGSVAAFSDGPGTGSDFVIRLPLLMEEPMDDRTTSQPQAEEPRSAGRQILVVDDNADTVAALAMLLEMTGNEAHTGHDGEEAVEAAERLRPDVALLDIGLPKLDGYEACRRIRAQPWGKAMKLVALTGWGQEEDRRRSREAGFDAHLVKPVDFGALNELLTRWGEEKRSA